MDTTRVHPLTRDDDTVEAHHSCLARLEAPHGTPHGCMNSLVHIGHMVEEDGEEVEVIESVPCRRCADSQ